MRKLYETQQQEQQAGKYLYSAVVVIHRAQPDGLCQLAHSVLQGSGCTLKKSGQLSPGTGNNWPYDNFYPGGSESVDGMSGSAVFVELVAQGTHRNAQQISSLCAVA